jgi:glycerophosphoryl diester phosphodiesterase
MPAPHAPRLYAHRGASAEAPENTLPAFVRALAIPHVNALELDVHLTRDGHPIVSHDPTARRMANRDIAWKDLDLAEARTLDVGWGFVAPDGSRPFAGQGLRVSTFEEVLRELPPVVLNVDLKPGWPPMAARMVRLVRAHHAEDRVVLASFHLATLLRRLPLRGTCAQLPEQGGPFTFARRAFIDRCHALGMRVDFWTINDPARARALWALGADGVMTDDPRAVAPTFPAATTR